MTTTDDIFLEKEIQFFRGKSLSEATRDDLLAVITALSRDIAAARNEIERLQKRTPDDFYATGQPVPYTPADGQW